MKELWHTIDEVDGLSVSSLGRVRIDETGQVYEGGVTKGGYMGLCSKKYKARLLIHCLVARYFVPNPNGYKHIKFKDENRVNPSADNLEWVEECWYKNPETPEDESQTAKFISEQYS